MDTRLHFINSGGGHIGGEGRTQPADVDAIVEALANDPRGHLVLHFHGGLVNRSDAEARARCQLKEKVYSSAPDSGGWPVFYVWESGPWEVIRNKLDSLAAEPVFKHLLRKLLQYALEKSLGRQYGLLEEAPMWGGRREEVASVFEAAWEKESEEAQRELEEVAVTYSPADAEALDEDALVAELQQDLPLQQALATLPGLSVEVRSFSGLLADTEHRSEFSLQAAAMFLDGVGAPGMEGQVLAPMAPAESWFHVLKNVAKFLAGALPQVIWRYIKGRDHGFHATCVEETVRAFKLPGGRANEWGKALQWNLMKDATREAFGGDPDLHAGTALLERLKRKADAGHLHLKRITLVGHSTGAIYIAHWLAKSKDYLPAGFKQDIVFLAPAITHEFWAMTLRKHGEGIGNFRMFAMKDADERRDQVLGRDSELAGNKNGLHFVYPSSLLYLVSGFLESRTVQGHLMDEADVPLLGLERFHSGTKVYSAANGFQPVEEVRKWLQLKRGMVVWTPTGLQADGMGCEAIDHSDFNDKQIYGSLRHIIEKGFATASGDG